MKVKQQKPSYDNGRRKTIYRTSHGEEIGLTDKQWGRAFQRARYWKGNAINETDVADEAVEMEINIQAIRILIQRDNKISEAHDKRCA